MNYNDVRNISDFVKIAGPNDYCYACALKMKKENKNMSSVDIKEALQGKLTNVRVFALNISGVKRCICKECCKEIVKDL